MGNPLKITSDLRRKGYPSSTDGGAKMTDRGMALKRINEFNKQYNNAVNGNVDYANRPIVSSKVMRDAGYRDFPMNDIATTYSSGYTLNDSKGRTHEIEATPIKNDGTVWTQNELDSYIGSLNNSPDILAADTEGLIINDAKNRKEAEQLNVLLDSIKNSQLGAMKDYANSLGQDVTEIDRNYLMALLRQLNR